MMRPAVIVAGGLAALALWWWEVACGGQVPDGGAAVAWSTLAWRCLGHVVLFGLLAAASWIDLRDRVIPDAITVPGVLLGIGWAALRPDSLLPVARTVPRSFAAPLAAHDVLGLAGPLQGAVPAWLTDWPACVAAGVVFVAWWWTCTAPFLWEGEPPRPRGGWREPRGWVLVAGLAGIAAACAAGGAHRLAVLTSLAGVAVGAGIVWLTRIGASRALGREALGFGDVTLMAMVGAWLGWQAAVLVCCLGVAIGILHGLAQIVLHRDNELPFGPSLCLGAAALVVGWRPLWQAAGPHFERPAELAAVVAVVIALTAASLAVWRRWGGRGQPG
jgi:prepilin signal peptidase PulO-like enzyme (type II secretory pathway)